MRSWGWKKDSLDARDWKYSEHPEYICSFSLAPLPTSADLRSEMSPIEDQGRLGSCVAHATCGNLEFLELQSIKNSLVAPENFGTNFQRLSRLFVYFNARALDGDTDRDAGTQLRSAVMAIRSAGICRETLWPYDVSQVFDTPVGPAYDEGKKHKVLSAYRIDNTHLISMKTCLAKGYPFIFGMSVFQSFMSSVVAATGNVPLPKDGEDILGGHALCCVGYDDSQGSFIVRNSWGNHWGAQGYCTIPYAYLTHPDLASDFWTIRKEVSQMKLQLKREDFQIGGMK